MSWHCVGPGGGPGRRLGGLTSRSTMLWALVRSVEVSSGVSPCERAWVRSLKIRGELTIRACSGCASGTWITSIRNNAELGFESGGALEHPASSLGDRTGADPDT